MRQDLLDLLICPACLPAERPLSLSGARRGGGEILSGTLDCRSCGRSYPIEDGLAQLLPESEMPPAPDKYSRPATVSAYLWSHFADLSADPAASEAYRRWAQLVPAGGELALDVGCAVGRLSFELAARGGLAIGLDRSRPLVAKARQLAREGFVDYPLTIEGRLSEPRRIELPDAWRQHPPEFLVADALALPFPAGSADRVCSLNLLDKVPGRAGIWASVTGSPQAKERPCSSPIPIPGRPSAPPRRTGSAAPTSVPMPVLAATTCGGFWKGKGSRPGGSPRKGRWSGRSATIATISS